MADNLLPVERLSGDENQANQAAPSSQVNTNPVLDEDEDGKDLSDGMSDEELFRGKTRKTLFAHRDKAQQFKYPYIDAKGKVAESSFYWYEDDVLCKCRPDLICPPLDNPDSKNEIVIVDYKTTQSVEPYTFAKSVKKFRYDLQASYYRRGMEAAGYRVTDFMFVAQEKTYPYASKVFRMTKEQMDFGWSIMETYLENYKEYKKGKTLSIYNSPNVIDLVL